MRAMKGRLKDFMSEKGRQMLKSNYHQRLHDDGKVYHRDLQIIDFSLC